MAYTRRRSDRTDWARRGRVSVPEILESRQVLSSVVPSYLSPWLPSDQYVTNPVTHQRELFSERSQINVFNPSSPGLNNAGKVVSGIDRAGDQWVITVHGPGKVIVTDTTPNDGELHDDINTIQLVGTSPTLTYVTGNVIASGQNLTSGVIPFNQLVSASGVRSIELNGFELSGNVSPSVSTQTGIFLYGGVQVLSFEGIDAAFDTSLGTAPYQIVIGNATTPLRYEPSIYLESIKNIVFDSTATTPPTTPVTTPSVEFMVNGVIKNFSIVSASRGPIQAGFEFQFPIVGTTGRTSIQATAINNLKVAGSAINVTAARGSKLFQAGNGLAYLHRASFGGNADALGLDVNGPIGRLTFKRGLGNPTGVFTAKGTGGQLLPATLYGTPKSNTGYPAAGLLGGTITATNIHRLVVKPANQFVQTAQNPLYVQLTTIQWPTYVASPGNSLSNAVITTSGSIDSASIKGTPLNSEIKTGFYYPAYVAGLEGTRAPSRISHLKQNGDLINSDTSATFRPVNHHYSRSTGIAGPGTIHGRVNGIAYNTGGATGLGNTGSGVFARTISKGLPAAP